LDSEYDINAEKSESKKSLFDMILIHTKEFFLFLIAFTLHNELGLQKKILLWLNTWES